MPYPSIRIRVTYVKRIDWGVQSLDCGDTLASFVLGHKNILHHMVYLVLTIINLSYMQVNYYND